MNTALLVQHLIFPETLAGITGFCMAQAASSEQQPPDDF